MAISWDSQKNQANTYTRMHRHSKRILLKIVSSNYPRLQLRQWWHNASTGTQQILRSRVHLGVMAKRSSDDVDCGDQPARRLTRDTLSKVERERFLSMSLGEKRKLYKCGSKYVTLDAVKTWSEYYTENIEGTATEKSFNKSPLKHDTYEANETLNDKVSLWRGDITQLEVDGIVNAANTSLMGGGGVDGAIHSAAGKLLKQECMTLGGCSTGDAKVTAGYNLPAKYVLHTVGPVGEHEAMLQSCYTKCLHLMSHHSLTSIAFPCISTGIYGYPNEKAALVALETIRKFLQDDAYTDKVERIVLCLFLPVDVDLYEHYMQLYFPTAASCQTAQS